MDDGAVLGQRGGFHQFVVPVDRERLVRLVDHRLDEVEQIARIKAGGRLRDAAGDVGIADDLDAIDIDDLARLGALDIAAAFDGEVDPVAEARVIVKELKRYDPAIGFVGTVRGIGNSLQQAHKAVEGDVSGVVAGLGTSFNSTLVALSLSCTSMILASSMTWRSTATCAAFRNWATWRSSSGMARTAMMPACGLTMTARPSAVPTRVTHNAPNACESAVRCGTAVICTRPSAAPMIEPSTIGLVQPVVESP